MARLYMNYDTVIFDLDGTLLDTLKDLDAAVNYALAEAGLAAVTLEQTREYVGNGVRNLMLRSIYGPEFVKVFKDIAYVAADSITTADGKRGLADGEGRFFEIPVGRDDFEKILADFRRYYSEHSLVNTKPYEGVERLISGLLDEGFAVAVVSNKFDAAVKDLCAHFFPQVKVAVGQQENIAKKPAPDMVNEALRQLGRSRGSAVYVGDSEVDIQTAANSDMRCISCAWGFRDEDFLLNSGADTMVYKPLDILDLLRGENERNTDGTE